MGKAPWAQSLSLFPPGPRTPLLPPSLPRGPTPGCRPRNSRRGSPPPPSHHVGRHRPSAQQRRPSLSLSSLPLTTRPQPSVLSPSSAAVSPREHRVVVVFPGQNIGSHCAAPTLSDVVFLEARKYLHRRSYPLPGFPSSSRACG